MTQLFSPLTLRGLTLKNRLVVSPMCQYSALDGHANDWHLVHLGRFTQGGFGLIVVEATAVTPQGRISSSDLGLWDDAHVPALKRIADFIHTQGAAAGIQLAHAGRKASTPKPWRRDIKPPEAAEDGHERWTPEAPSALAHSATHQTPAALDAAGIERLKGAFVAATRRAEAAGFDFIEVHAAHGYLLNEFLSPLANRRTDAFGGTRENRMRFPLQVIAAIRDEWPQPKPLSVRISASDNHPDGWTIEDSIAFSRQLKALQVDVVTCSSGGFEGASIKPEALYQVPFAEAVRRGADIATIAVGLITEPHEAESILADGRADLIALARAALDDPNWPLHARLALEASAEAYGDWPIQAGYAVQAKDRALGCIPMTAVR